ncbi:hypothetical protein [Polyangium spumosum]|uniref:Uncharacterized protein n=1 Tax=Polyangium spumosum TaxID=889282 RepID=A0A6N7PXN2_9BACT|nr:hypothetical protein [Polyangium spumosum]MRG96743.1 hypothetical protein [Polyangium spumosum]
MGASLNPGFFLLRRPRHLLRASTSIALVAPVWDNDTYGGEDVSLADIPILLTYTALPFIVGRGAAPGGLAGMRDPTLAGAGDHRTWLSLTSGASLPASRWSRSRGLDASTHLGAAARQQIKLLGDDAAGLNWVLISLSFDWQHDFYGASPVVPAGVDSFGEAASILFPLYRSLQLAVAYRLSQRLLPPPPSSPCVVVVAGCVTPERVDSPTSTAMGHGVRLELSYLFVPELGASLAYANEQRRIGLDGKTSHPFVGLEAIVQASVELSIDRLYQRIQGPPSEGR